MILVPKGNRRNQKEKNSVQYVRHVDFKLIIDIVVRFKYLRQIKIETKLSYQRFAECVGGDIKY